MRLFRIRNYGEYLNHTVLVSDLLKEHIEYLASVVPDTDQPFCISGYSYPAGKQVDFIIDNTLDARTSQILWRETVVCPETYFNNRMRASVHLFDLEMNFYNNQYLYITEKITPMYHYFSKITSNICGSEFLGGQCPLGENNIDGIRNENLCNLTFEEESFDALISLDVFEHIPNYTQAFAECARVLKPRGRMLFSVPFASISARNIICSRVVDGHIVHDLPPEYHGNPLSNEGILCFQVFGWEVLDQLRAQGFRDAYALCYFSAKFGYLGGEQFIFIAIK